MDIASAAEQLAVAGCVYAEEEASILVEVSSSAEELDALVARRVAGEPLEYVVGWAEFGGLRFAIDDGVFVPRPRSGFLVEEAASLVRCLSESRDRVVVVDLCCGVGAIGAALAAELPQVDLYAADIDPRAVGCAERNLVTCGGHVYQGDLFDALPRRLRRRTDVVMASPPYVPTDEIRVERQGVRVESRPRWRGGRARPGGADRPGRASVARAGRLCGAGAGGEPDRTGGRAGRGLWLTGARRRVRGVRIRRRHRASAALTGCAALSLLASLALMGSSSRTEM